MSFEKIILEPVLKSINDYKDRNCFCIDDVFYTYKQFGEAISKIRLEIKSVTDSNIGLVVNDDIETYASIFALWLEGKSYVSLHPNQPIDRSLNIIEQVGIKTILDSNSKTKFSNAICTSNLLYTISDLSINKVYPDDNLAYILFTSGSTGQPKGVPLTRKNLYSFIEAFDKCGMKIDCTDRCLQAFDLVFDVSVQSYLYPLIYGACVYTVPLNTIKYIYIAGLIDEHKITFGALAPSMIRMMKPYYDQFDASSIKYCLMVAEASPVGLLDEWAVKAYNADILDFYGPTEATIYCTYSKYNREGINKSVNGLFFIGKPMDGVDVIIVDENLNNLPTGSKGELCVCGVQLTPGYWNNEERNKKAFFYKEINGVRQRFYHTGDYCYMDNDGDIMYFGRMDFQAKIQGYRVELGEIEFHAREYLKGINVAAIPYDNKDGNTEICMFIESDEFEVANLSKYMREKMPSYMVPTKFHFVKTFPLNTNSKLDRNILKEMLHE